MVAEARALRGEIGGNLFIKLPVTREGFAAIPRIVREGMQVTATGIHSSMQGFMAAKAGARYVAPYVNRMDNYGHRRRARRFRNPPYPAHLRPEGRRSGRLLQELRAGPRAGPPGRGAITARPRRAGRLIKNPATDAAIADQNRDFGILVGERRTWLDLIKEK